MACLMKLWLFCSCMIYSRAGTSISVKMLAHTIQDVSSRIHSYCIYLIVSADSGMREKLVMINLEKRLGTFAAVLTSKDVQQAVKNVSCRRNRPLYVVMSGDSSTKNALEKVSQRNSDFGEARWLILLLGRSTEPQTYLNRVDIPLDCELLFLSNGSLVEVSRVSQHLHLLPAGSWTPNGEFHWHCNFLRKTFYERRRNLMGTIIRTTAQFDGTTVREENGTVLEVGGFFGNLWQELENRLNFRTEYIVPGNRSHHSDSWSRPLRMVMNGEAEVAVGAFIMMQHLLNQVHFLLPFGKTSVAVFLRAPVTPLSTNWNGYLAPFTTSLWKAFLVALFLLILGLTFTYRVGRNIGNAEAEETVHQYDLAESVLCVFGSFCQQGQDRTPRSWPCRLVYLTSYLLAVVVLAAYSATFISFLTVNQVPLPFSTFHGLLQNRNFRLGILNNSVQLYFFQNATDEDLSELYKSKIEPYLEHSPANILEGLHRICILPNYGFVCDSTLQLIFRHQVQCTVVSLPQVAIPASGTFVISRKSRLRRILNSNMAQMRQTGELRRLYLNSIPAAIVKDSADGIVKPSVYLEEILPPLTFLAGSMVLSAIILLAERIIYRLQMRPDRGRLTYRQCYTSRRTFRPPEHYKFHSHCASLLPVPYHYV